jgi:hypothetical protein
VNKGWIDRRKEFDILLDECRAEWRRRHPLCVSMDPDNEKLGDPVLHKPLHKRQPTMPDIAVRQWLKGPLSRQRSRVRVSSSPPFFSTSYEKRMVPAVSFQPELQPETHFRPPDLAALRQF